jgi:hypothetical protein
MVIFTEGKSRAIHSPRYLTLRHVRRAVRLKKRSLGVLGEHDDDDEPELEPGYEMLSSFWVPGLLAGAVHRIKVNQKIDSPRKSDPSMLLEAEQPFFVDAPRFFLPEGSVHSVYPPSGYAEDHRILPHIVLTDPHLPWERRMQEGISKKELAKARNQVPWVALITFTQDELKLAPDVLERMFRDTSLPKPVQQTSTLAINTKLDDYWKTNDTTKPIKEDPLLKDESGDFIFIPAELFTSLFSPFDKNNKRQNVPHPDPSPFKYLSHVRKINTTGMAVSGVEEIGIFSIVVGYRSGMLDNLTDATVSVHLVSIEGIQRVDFPIKTPYVSLCSLHSWNYTVQAPGQLNVRRGFTNLGSTLNVLRAPDALIDQFRGGDDVAARLAKRLEDGFSLVKYRVQTGEETVALYRGPFTPTTVRELQLTNCSNSGVDLQILDKQVGIMDITYSSAWQLGKTLALGDQAFTAALGRLRTAIHTRAMREAKLLVVTAMSENAIRRRTEILSDLSDMVKNLDQIHLSNTPDEAAPFIAGGPLQRWHRRRLRNKEVPGLGFSASAIEDIYLDEAIKAARSLAKATDGTIYDETNTPVSTDWMAVMAWVLDRMFLVGVPAHYLILDPTHLEPESLKFFYIDPNWIDALVDGALSLGNHMGVDKDRVAIKTALNDYIRHKPHFQMHTPQIPAYGFLLRSDLVTMFPDLKVNTLPEPKVQPPTRAPLLRHEIIADGVMLAFLDQPPASDTWNGLVFTQPPHQERFAVSSTLEVDSALLDIRRQYTVDRKLDPDRYQILETLPVKPQDVDNFFVWGSTASLTDLHILRLPRFAKQQLEILKKKMPAKYFNDDTATSALLAMQLNDPIYSLTIGLTTASSQAALRSLTSPGDGAAVEPDVPRTLQQLSLPRVDKYKLPNEADNDDDDISEPDDFLRAVAPLFQHDASYKPAPHVLLNLAPHVRAIPTETTTPAADISPLTTLGPSQVPGYTCNIHSVSLSDVRVDKDTLPQDLVFSVVAEKQNKHTRYKLKEFAIKVPLGSIKDRALMETYDGPGASMLSNLRFNVLVSFLTEGTSSFLKLRLVPRSEKGYIDVPKVKEMGFLLSLATVNPYQHQDMIDIYTVADYDNDPDSPHSSKFPIMFSTK